MDYKDTLNLPSTKFPMKANLPQKEPEILKFWDDINLYQSIRAKMSGADKYTLHDGPPYANGDIHIGHAVNKILKDFVVKSRTMFGYDCPFIPGWDCHGLPIELMVEKKYGKSRFKEDKNAFRKACREFALKQVKKQKSDFIRLGVTADWSNPYLSMDKDFEASTIESFAKILSNNHIYYGSKPVHWCIESESALAEAEVEYQDVISKSVYVVFTSKMDNENVGLVIWTTTPWTLPANRAIAVGEDIGYCVAQNGKSKYIFATDLLTHIENELNIKLNIVKKCSADELVKLEVKHPFYDLIVPVIVAPHVNTETGTGLVHIAPGHGQEDYLAGIENNLEVFNPVDAKGFYNDSLEFFGGLNVRDADQPIIDKIKENNCLLGVKDYSHSYPHCWRFKTPLIFRATPQWFISMENNNLRNNVSESIGKVEWIPGWGSERIKNMINNRPDWCISRQRFWGVPIPLLVHRVSGELHPKIQEFMKKAADIVRHGNIEAWFEYDKTKILDENLEAYELVSDTLDVWFDSGVTHISVMEERENVEQADLYLEGSDQHRGWFQSSLLTSLAIKEKAPYKKVLTHGFVVDAKGEKMSKSLGNVISPQAIIKEKGSDILRLWVATTDYTKEMNISDEIIKRTSESYRRIRNTLKFLISNVSDYDGKSVGFDKLTLLDKWILWETKNLQERVEKNYRDFKFHQIVQDIQNFCTVYLGGYYLDIIKDRLYTTKKESTARRSCQTTCFEILNFLNLAIAPILSFTSEETFRYYKNDRESIFLEEWKNISIDLTESEINVGKILFNLKEHVSKELEDARNNGIIKSSLDAEIQLAIESDKYRILKEFQNELKFIFISSKFTLVETKDGDLKITIKKSNEKKCERCWHHDGTVGTINEHKKICRRCYSNIFDSGEVRTLG